MEERLTDTVIEWDHESSVCITLVSKGYPGKYAKGSVIEGLERAQQLKNVFVFHEHTAFQDRNIISAGGRVISITAAGSSRESARKQAYRAAEIVHFDGMRLRTDVGHSKEIV
jgi:phosphoribosylamine--glycine ligase